MNKAMTQKDYQHQYYWTHPEYRQRCIEQSRERSKAQHIKELQEYCCEPIENIENYELAKADNFKGWHCHHKLGVHSDYRNTRDELIMMNLYYNRPACELIFLTKNQHTSIHKKDSRMSDEQKVKLSASHKGKTPWNKGIPLTEECKQRISESKKGCIPWNKGKKLK